MYPIFADAGSAFDNKDIGYAMDDETTLRRKTAMLTRMLNLQGTIGMFGHVSVRVPGTNRVLLSPGGGTDKAMVEPDDIFVFDVDGNILQHPGGLIPLEWRIHTRIHRDRPETMCIAHLHARHATVLGIAGHDVVPVFLHGSFLHGGVTPEECILPVSLLTPKR